jgi:hypothetical protein
VIDDVCACGHVEDEHDLEGGCQVEGCPCIAFDPEESEEEWWA